MKLPVYERRYYLGQLTKDAERREEQMEKMKENSQVSSDGRGNRKRKISGSALKSQIKNGDLPLQ